jgi:hypothetical protein
MNTTTTTGKQLVGGKALLEILWPNPEDRPCLRWLKHQQAARRIPFIKLGALVWFDPDEVRAEIAARHTIKARGVA